jgi:hypothetical protein
MLESKTQGDGSTAWIAIAWKPIFQANFQIIQKKFSIEMFFLIKIFWLG